MARHGQRSRRRRAVRRRRHRRRPGGTRRGLPPRTARAPLRDPRCPRADRRRLAVALGLPPPVHAGALRRPAGDAVPGAPARRSRRRTSGRLPRGVRRRIRAAGPHRRPGRRVRPTRGGSAVTSSTAGDRRSRRTRSSSRRARSTTRACPRSPASSTRRSCSCTPASTGGPCQLQDGPRARRRRGQLGRRDRARHRPRRRPARLAGRARHRPPAVRPRGPPRPAGSIR